MTADAMTKAHSTSLTPTHCYLSTALQGTEAMPSLAPHLPTHCLPPAHLVNVLANQLRSRQAEQQCRLLAALFDLAGGVQLDDALQAVCVWDREAGACKAGWYQSLLHGVHSLSCPLDYPCGRH